MAAIASHKMVEAIFQRALDAPGPIKVGFSSHGDAINARQRLNAWRIKDRRDSVTIYPVGHPLHDASIYDTLSMRIPPPDAPDSHYIYITKRKTLEYEIEDITPAQSAPLKVEEISDLEPDQLKINNELESILEQALDVPPGTTKELDIKDFPELWRTRDLPPKMFCTICGKDFDTAGRRPRYMCDACSAREGDDTRAKPHDTK